LAVRAGGAATAPATGGCATDSWCPPDARVHHPPARDVPDAGSWSFQDSSLSCRHPKHGSIGRFDPFPAYPHDAGVAADAAQKASQACPPLYDIEIYLPNREEVGRTNGYSTNCYPRSFVDGEWVTGLPLGLIVMSGKRIPPHPAMTRYLIGHEYGHHVCWMLGKLRGATHLQDDSWLAEYAKLRGLPDTTPPNGSGGNWHRALEEIFACDFRILILEVESEYWPHPGTARPDTVQGLADWWAAAHDELRAADPIT
jgi:hypothetical protein